MSKRQITLIGFLILLSIGSFGQKIETTDLVRNGYFLTQIENPIDLNVEVDSSFITSRLKISLITVDDKRYSIDLINRNDGYYVIPHIAGTLEIVIEMKDTQFIQLVPVKPLSAKVELGVHQSGKISKGSFKGQSGLTAFMCCGFDGRCLILGYQVTRIDSNGIVKKVFNKGGRYEKKAQLLIGKASKGDKYIFSYISYQCPGAAQAQKNEDLIFVIL